MPPHPHHHGHHGGGGGRRGGWGGPWWGGGGDVFVINEPCTAQDENGNRVMVPCDSLGDDVAVIDEVVPAEPRILTPIQQAIRIASGRRLPGPTAYYRNPGAEPERFPFQWGGWAGGQPTSRVAAESRELSGLAGGDLYQSGLNSYTRHYPAIRDRGLPRPPQGLSGIISDLSDNEKNLALAAGVAAIAFYLWKKRRKSRRR